MARDNGIGDSLSHLIARQSQYQISSRSSCLREPQLAVLLQLNTKEHEFVRQWALMLEGIGSADEGNQINKWVLHACGGAIQCLTSFCIIHLRPF